MAAPRRYVEDTLVVRDWFELTVAQNLVSDGFSVPAAVPQTRRTADGQRRQVGMLTEFMRLWFAESQRWVDALLKTVVNESAANKALVQGWVDHWSHRSVEALQALRSGARSIGAGYGVQRIRPALKNSGVRQEPKHDFLKEHEPAGHRLRALDRRRHRPGQPPCRDPAPAFDDPH